MSQLHHLLQLQETDDEIRDKKQRLREVLQAQKGSDGLDRAQRRHERSAAALADAQRRQKELEFELNQVNTKRQRSSDRLYSGKVQNPKELTDLQHEIESLGRRRGDLEDQLLEVMIEVESAQEEDQEAAALLHEEQERWERQKSALAKEQDELATRLNRLLTTREGQVARLDQKHLSAYENTRSKRGGIAVAVVKDGMCQACGVRVSSSKVSAAQEGTLMRCGSCDRILVIR